MPESKKRKKSVYSAPPTPGSSARKRKPSPVWLAPAMLALFGIGIVWLVIFYLTQGDMIGVPVVEDWGNGNLLAGFAFIVAGFGLSTQWR